MRLLVCNCGGHEFVVFHDGWKVDEAAKGIASGGLISHLHAACIKCGEDWGLEHVLWMDIPEKVETP